VEIDSEGSDFRVDGHGFAWSHPERTTGRRVIRTARLESVDCRRLLELITDA
jgi:hypothetical protein